LVTNAGGPGILFADSCEAHGLQMPKLKESTLGELRSYLPMRSGFANPIDMTAAAPPDHYTRTLRLVGNDPNVDSVVAIYIPPMVTNSEDIAAAIARAAAEIPLEKPVLSVFLLSHGAPEGIHAGTRGVIPTYAFPENAALALAASYRYARFKNRPRGRREQFEAATIKSIRAIIEGALEGATASRWLTQAEIAALLGAAGIEVASFEQAGIDDVRAAAERIGFPLVAKAVAPGLVHKTEIGGVMMHIDSAAEAESAACTLEERMRAAGTHLDAVLLQRQITAGIEMLVGMTSDPTFGPLLLCGMGGVNAELQKDVSFRLPPVTDEDAEEMLTNLRMSRLFDGYRGAPPGDREALSRLIMRISALVEAAPELTEFDLNPVKVLEPGKGAIVIDARMRIRPLAKSVADVE
jgi:acetate---CoA ligase (ADP-forming)